MDLSNKDYRKEVIKEALRHMLGGDCNEFGYDCTPTSCSQNSLGAVLARRMMYDVNEYKTISCRNEDYEHLVDEFTAALEILADFVDVVVDEHLETNDILDIEEE